MLHVIVLGAAAGGGVPQWNCGCTICQAARQNSLKNLRRTQASLAISGDSRHWFLINASPDLRQQVTETSLLHPHAGHLRHSPIAGVILTNGEVDAVAGLLSLRESSPFTIFAHQKVLGILDANSIFNVLNPKYVRREAIALDAPFEPLLNDGSLCGLELTAFATPGKIAWYLEGSADHQSSEGDTLGLRIKDKATGASCYVLTACARVTPDLRERLRGAAMLFFDGTVWRDDEMIAAGLGAKTGQDMGHIAMSGPDGAIAALADLDIGQKIFLHINNSNPALLDGSPERHALEAAGWQVPQDGWEVTL